MAEQWQPSEFLRFQDKNNDGLQDICPPMDIVEIEKCPACIIKPNALLPRWKNRSKFEPFLNERRCVYQITYKTPYKTTGAVERYGGSATPEQAQSVLEERAEIFKKECAEILIDHYNKQNNDENISKVAAVMEFTDWDLDPRPMSHLKHLYSVPFNAINDLNDAEEDDDEDEDIDTSDIVTTLIAGKINSNMKRIRTTLNFYASSLKVYRAIEGRNLVFVKGGVFNLEKYGDFAPFGDSITERLVPQLNDFLDRKGISLFLPHWFFGNNWMTAEKIEFTFTHDYRLKKMKVFTKGGCRPHVFRKKRLKSLNSGAWKDRTAVAFFAKQNDMIRDITARSPKPWVEFLLDHTYPKLKTIRTHNPIKISKTSDEADNRTIMGCIGDALEDEVKQLGQDIKDDIFSMGDALAHQFNKKICLEDIQDLVSEDFKLGYIDDPGSDPTKPYQERQKNIFQYAQEQAFKEINDKDMLFAGLCARMASIFGGSPQNMLDKMWRQGWDPTMLCGLFDMLLDVIQCLFKGLTFEELLASAIRSALKAMSIEDFGFLFIGLPADKRAKLDAMVKQKLESGDIFAEGSPGQRLSDSIENRNRDGSSTVPQNAPFFPKKVVIEHPWENKELVEEQNRNHMKEGPLSGFSPSGIPGGRQMRDSQLSRATASQQFKNIGEGLNPDVIMEAYIAALIEEYSNNLTDLMKHLDNLPGAPIISYIIATLDCPIPPLFNPTIADFLGDLALPFCKNKYHIGPPRIDNIFAWLPKINDILWFLYWLARYILQQIIIIIAMRLMVWLCELLSDFICNALGSLAAGIKAVAQGGNFFDGVRDFICGPEASDEEVEETIQGLFQNFGSPEDAALQDKEKVMSFVEDLSSAISRKELADAIAGEPSGAFFEVVENLIEFEYPEFEGTFGNRAKTSAFFGNIGKLMPLEARDGLSQFRDMLDDDDFMPANPSLCATPEDVEAFCEARAELLQGRATPLQIEALCDAGRDSIKKDLEDIGDIFQKGIPVYFDENMPPLVSTDPTCDDGILPYEPPVIREATVNGMKSTFDPLEMAYVEDMIGDGRRRASQWGWLNMVLSDTMGNPYTSHQFKVFTGALFSFARASYIDYYVPGTPAMDDPTATSAFAATRLQHGAYPSTIAIHLKNQIGKRKAQIDYRLKNDVQDTQYFYQSYKDLGFTRSSTIFGPYADIDVELTTLPDYGYNVKPVVEWSNQRVKFIKRARKLSPDVSLMFRDGGPFPSLTETDDVYTYGYNIKLFTCDIEKRKVPDTPPILPSERTPITPKAGESSPPPPPRPDTAFYNAQNDPTRVIIDKTINLAYADFGDKAFAADDGGEDSEESGAGGKYLDWQDMEFIAYDSTLEYNPLIVNGDYINFNSIMASPATNLAPPLHLLHEMASKLGRGVPSVSVLQYEHGEIMNNIFKSVMTSVQNNTPAFTYGSQLSNISKEQLEYGIEENGSFIEASDYIRREVVAGLESGDMWNPNMMPMGMSRMEFDEQFNDGPRNRVHYLDPAHYGGKKWNPPFYIEPIPANGWLGMAQVIFPEYSPCEPKNVNLVNFEEIKDAVQQGYSKIPEDKRLQKDPDCVIEKPYNRILQRSGKAQIEGLVKTACKMFASIEMIKAYCVFGKFYPDFRNNFSNIFASYIVEIMEEELKDAQNDILELFTPFKDDEFWYAFLEQSVQTYARLLESGDIREPAPHILDALDKLERYEANYDVPNKSDFRRAKRIGDTSPREKFKNYRYEKVLEGVQATEDIAKVILAEFVSIELDTLGKTWTDNMEKQGLLDDTEMIRNLGYYVLQNLCSNTSLDLHKTIVEQVADAPTEDTSGLYTTGGEFIYRENTPYVGYYHAHKKEDGKIIFMEGEKHTDESHEELFPLANKVIVPIGSIGSLTTTASDTLPFKAETYMMINDTEFTIEAGIDYLRKQPNAEKRNVSEVFPGNMELVISETSPNLGKPVGIKGQLGVRYGLKLSMSSNNVTLLRTEIDVLDVPLARVIPLESNSKQLFCLINNLVDSPEFDLMFKYIFPLPKILSSIAMYSSLGFVASIGEVQTSINTDDVFAKPGNVVLPVDSTYRLAAGQPGWATKRQRYPGWSDGWGYRNLHFDRWSRQELSKSKGKLKKQFKIHYFGRKFDPGKTSIKDGGFGIDRMNKGNSAYLVSQYFKDWAAMRNLPWYKIRMMRRNPFNANKEKCKKV